jgi:hypothetical protein
MDEDRRGGTTATTRQWAKKTPSPASLREKVIRNCMSAIKLKRSSLLDERRTNGESRDDALKAFVSEMFHATKRDDHYSSLDYGDESEMLTQIADAIQFELEMKREMDSELYELIESEEFARISLYEQGDDVVICPMCRYSSAIGRFLARVTDPFLCPQRCCNNSGRRAKGGVVRVRPDAGVDLLGS